MNPQSLHALIIDRHLGELSPEAVELLELHLAQHADARAEAERILDSLNATRDAVLRHPEMARVAVAMENVASQPSRRSTLKPWLARAAAVLLLATLTGVGGFMAGRTGSQPVAIKNSTDPVLAIAQSAPRRESPWAQYRMTFDPAGEGMHVVRVDAADGERKAIR